jgi:Concanavalin A-like lectin/glucanases superfamily
MNLKSILSLVFCVGIVYNLHSQILPSQFGVPNPSRLVANPIVTSGLVLHLDAGNTSSYPGSGNTWTDLSGNGNHGILINGPTYSSANGGSIVFDGSDDIVSSFSTQISGTGSKTISSWIKINITSRAGIAGTRSLAECGWGFTVNRNGTGNLAFYDTRGSELSVAAGLGTNIWYNVCVTLDDSRIVSLYVNGSRVGISSTPFSALNASTFNGVIGNEDESNNPFYHPFNGNIAQVIIYNRALTAAEVLQNYNALSSRF